MRKLFSSLVAIALTIAGGLSVAAQTIVTDESGLDAAITAQASEIVVQGTINVTTAKTINFSCTLKGDPSNGEDVITVSVGGNAFAFICRNSSSASASTGNDNSITVQDLTFSSATYNGGALNINPAPLSITVNRCKFLHLGDESAGQNGGAITFYNNLAMNVTASITNCIFANNKVGASSKNGGAICVNNMTNGTKTVNIINAAFYNNSCTNIGSAVARLNGGTVNIINSIAVGGNKNEFDNNQTTGLLYAKNCYYGTSQTTATKITYTDCVSGKTAAACFTDAANGDFTPPADFVGIGAGNQTVISAVGATDIAGNPRVNGKLDIGAYENQQKKTVSVDNVNVSISPSGANNAAYLESFDFTLTPSGSYIISSVNNGQETLVPDVNGTYTIASVADDIELTVIAELPQSEVTVTTTGVTVTSPTLSNDQFSTGTTATITFTLNAGYESPSVTVDGDSYALAAPENGVYTVSLTGLSGATTVAITASQIEYSIAKTESNATVSFTGGASATMVHYNDVVTGTVNATSPYHSPYVTVNGVYTALDGNNEFTFTVTGNTTVAVTAFAENVIPVSEDSYVTSGIYAGIANNSGSTVQVEYSTYGFSNTAMGRYMRHSYFQFNDIPAGYNKAQLRLTFSATENKGAGKKVDLDLRTVPASLDAIAVNDITWTNSGEFTDNTTGYPLLGESASSTALSVVCPGAGQNNAGDEFLFDIDTDVVDLTSGSIRLQLAATSTSTSDGSADFYSLENGNPDYVPVLVFTKEFEIPANDTKSYDDYTSEYNNIIFYSNDNTGTGQLTGASASPVNGVVKVVKTFATDKWYPIGFPFNIDKISINNGTTTHVGIPYIGMETVPADPDDFVDADNDDSVTDNFFLAEYDGDNDEFEFTQTFTQNKGYVIEFPESEFGVEPVLVTFTSTANPSLTSTGSVSVESGYSLVANPGVANAAGSVFNGASYFYEYDLDDQHFDRVNGGISLSTDIKPFEALVVTAESSNLRSSIGIGATETPVALPAVITKDPVVKTEYYNLQGQKYSISPKNGISAGTPYIVKEVHQSGKVTSKVISGK
ncbi:MAG: DUF5123 domain-containing protein [Candidatus Symbiothrix sp.]|jgi:hypothetical protein|nr:DUF5123 domain-containing protein [Candidatus Symbiothrix sp.]